MPTPSSLSRYRPAVLVLTGAAAAYAAYLVYSTLQAAPSDGLHRSNAVRRRLRPRESTSARALSLSLALHEAEVPPLGNYALHDLVIPLHPHNLVSATEMRRIIVENEPDASPETIERGIDHVYAIFLDRLLAYLFQTRPLSPIEMEAVRRWLGDRIPDPTAIGRAAERHTLSFPLEEAPAVDGTESVVPTEVSWRSDEDAEGDALDPDGQTLQRTLYHIAEDRARQEGVAHRGIICNGCDEKPIRGVRWHCANCVDFDLCSTCEAANSHYKTHIFYKIRVPAPYLGLPKQDPLYPGKPQMMSPSIDSVLKKHLVSETKMEAEEVEALWDQFSCLAGTEWVADTSGVGWALDRRAFDHAFVPRYIRFAAAPNLIYDRIFAYYDTDKNGLIGFDEWIKGVAGMHTTDVEVKSRIVFNGYDVDGDGYISRKDVLRLFRAYYAIEKEATKNYVAELTEELSGRNAIETIRSSQPLGSAFPPPPNDMVASNASNTVNTRLWQKQQNGVADTTTVLEDNSLDTAERDEILGNSSVQTNFVAHRWRRREFFIDEEEGLSRPNGAEDLSDNTIQHHERPRCSRSSSRVRFQDDVDVETRSNASTSSRPVGERWGGYEVPVPERDLGKEVLYQITQQGFNELLDPLFQDKEDMAMDAYETRSERRKLVTDIDKLMETFRTTKGKLEAISQVGIFCFSKCVVDMLCRAVNSGIYSDIFREVFKHDDDLVVSRHQAYTRLSDLYDSVEESVLGSIEITRTGNLDEMVLWNTMLCKQKLHDETLQALSDCMSYQGWIPFPVSNQTPAEVDHSGNASLLHRGPTMPQFRPDPLANVDDMLTAPDGSVHASDDSRASDGTQTPEIMERLIHDHGVDLVITNHERPFFVVTAPGTTTSNTSRDSDPADHREEVRLPFPSRFTVITHSNEDSVNADEASSSAPPVSTQNQNVPKFVINWRSYNDNPVNLIISVDATSVTDEIRYFCKPIEYSGNSWKLLTRSLRQLAMNPASSLHLIMLASLETVEQEIRERKGSGLVSLEEFAERMREGKLRFLETWMEWLHGYATSAV